MSLFENWFLFNLIKQNLGTSIVNSLYFEKRKSKVNGSFLANRTDHFYNKKRDAMTAYCKTFTCIGELNLISFLF